MKAESKYDLPLQIPSNKSVSELINKSPHLLRTHLAYFLSITLKNNDINLLNYLLSADTLNSQKIWNDFLLQCTELGKCNMITLLLQKGHNPNVQNEYGETPMHIAASKGDYEAIKLLQVYKANCFIKTKENLTPYDYAIEQGDKKVIDLLKRQKNNSMRIEDTARDTEDDEVVVSPREVMNQHQVKTMKKYDMPCRINLDKILMNNNNNNVEDKEREDQQYGYESQSAKERNKVKVNYVFNDMGLKSTVNEQLISIDCEDNGTMKREILTKQKDSNYDELFFFPTINFNESNTIVKVNKSNDVNGNVNANVKLQSDDNDDNNVEEEEDNQNEEKEEKEDEEQEAKSDLLKTIPLELNENNILNAPFFNNLCKDLQQQPHQHQQGSSSSNVDTYQSNHLHNSPSKAVSNISQPSEDVFHFLDEIKLSEYTQLLIKNGFDDIKVIIDQTKRSIAISDQNLIEAGINIPGDRAKILIHLEEKAKLFDFDLKKDNVYYKPINMGESTSRSDRHIQSLYRFLSSIKMECFLENFVNAGYASIDLILVQMLSRQPLAESKLQSEFGIEKIGYRARLMTKFRDEANNYISKLKNRNIVIDSPKNDNEFCNCCIY